MTLLILLQFPFEDPTGQIHLPPAVHGRVASWKRPAEVTAGQAPPPWVIVSPKRYETFQQFHIQSESEKAFLRAKKLRVKPKMLVSALTQCHSLLTMMQEAHYGFIGPNKHMFESDVSLSSLLLLLLLLL